MGNRATVIFTNQDEKDISPAVYLHWNGGPESIYAFLDEMDRRNIRVNDTMYECARFIHIVGDFFDMDEISSLSLGVTNGPKKIEPKELEKTRTDHGDNGFYIIHRMNKGRRVKRFVCKYDKKYTYQGIHEVPLKEVKAEMKRAYENRYNTPDPSDPKHKTIAQYFIKIQGKRKIEE
jgi:hypothetical protein